MPRSARRSATVARIAIWSALALVLLMLAAAWARDWSQQAAPRDAMRRAEASGAYHFAADVSQKTIPLPSVTSVGRRSQDEMFHLEGRTDRSSQTMEMRLWGDGGSVLDPGSGTELKVQGEETFARHTGQEWQKVDSFTGLFAPQGDFFGLLAAARDFSPIDGGEGAVKRYSFRLDGTSFATLMRDQLEQAMREKGQLPSGVNLDLPQMYVNMEGQGELWIGDDGLPARQIVHLVLPSIPGRDERVEADITITFAQFAPMAAGLNLANWLPSAQMLQNAIWAALILALTTVLLRKHRSRPVYAIMAGTVVLSLVTSPVLQGLKIADFNTTQAAQAAEQRQQQSATDAQRQARDQMLTSSFDPRSSPLQPAPAMANMAGLPNLSNLLDSTTDTDSDGLPDELEDRIGTSPTADDTDGDSIGDAQEARGFSFGSGMWYLDPREMDSNKDGIDDRREWRRDANLGQTPQDTDGDGSPDLFDADNDNDGVPDRYDLSPFQKQAALGPSQPFQFRVPDLQANTPAFVEFQIRPADTKHLWYALNVLDWPNGDRKGQIQDQDGKTFADTGDRSAPNTANGDIKLVPMLELRMDASSANLPSADELKPYGIIVRDVDQKTKLAYVPLAIVTDAQETRVAFSGKMRYKSNGSWDAFHEARLIWMVQVLVDQCTNYGNDAECQAYGALNQMQVVQTYSEDAWTLTGLNIREEHGTDIALAYEDPQADPSIQDDTPIVALTTNLEQSFLVGRDDNANNKRDIGVTTASSDSSIAGRFNGGSTATAEQRWNMPSYLRVSNQSFTTADEAIKTIVGTTTPATLQKFPTTAKPLLMFAREDRFRATNLDAIAATQSGQGVRWDSGNTLASQQIQTMAYLNLAPYCNQGGWAACTVTDYWNALEQRYAPAIQGTPAEQERGWGQLILAQAYHVALMHGVSNIVQQANAPVAPLFRAASDQPLAATIVNGGGKGGIFVINQVVNKLGLEQGGGKLIEILGVLHASGGGAAAKATADLVGLTKVLNLIKGNKVKVTLGLVAVGLAVAAVATVAILGLTGVFGDIGKSVTLQIITGVLEVGMAALSVIFLIKEIVTVSSTVSGSTSVFSKAASVLGNSKTAAILTLVLSIGVTWGVFIYQIVTGGLTPASPAFTTALSQALTGTVLAVLTFVIGLSVGGALVLAVIGLIDAIIGVVCRATNSQGSFCAGIMRTILEELSARSPLYNRELLPSLGSGLLKAGKIDTRLKFPELGFVENNSMVFELPLTTTIAENPSAVGWRDRNHKKEDLPRTTFKYELAAQKRWVDAWINDMAGDWQLLNGREPSFNYTHTWVFRSDTRATATIPLLVGVNRPMPLYLNIGYALPSRTWLWPFYWWDPQGTRDSYSVSLGDSFVFDVFPDTLDKFYKLDGAPYGYGVSWLRDGPKQKDADGDGLLAQTREGVDPDDAKWDTDGDGLSDAYELKMGAQGFSATNPDRDGDGLRDGEEARQETNPAKADTDGDGLTDRQEIFGWMITVAGQQFKATSDPRIADADGDGLGDLAEYGLASSGYHPQVVNTLPYSVYSSTAPATLVRPGQTIDYTAVLQNKLSTQWMGGSITAKLPDSLGGSSSTSGITLLPDDMRTFTAQFTAPQAASQVFSIVGNVEMNVEGVPGIGAQPVTVRQQSVTTLKLDADAPSSGISSLQNGQRVRMVADGSGGQVGDSTGNTLIIGGMASDPTSRVAKVEVSVNGGGWQAANGSEAWSYPLVTSGEGSYTIQTRAIDIAGNQGAASQIGIVVDNTPPQVAPSGNAGYFFANRGGTNGRWQVNLTGTVGDPASAGQAGSGAGTVEVRLVGIGGTAVDGPRGNGWQAAAISGGSWSINYVFPEDTEELTGEYRFLVRATDKVGNTSAEVAASGSVRMDNSAPVVTFGWQPLPENALAQLPLDEPAGTSIFEDRSGRGNGGQCAGTACPTAGVSGRSGSALQFDGVNDVLDLGTGINLVNQSFSASFWAKRDMAGREDYVIHQGPNAANQGLHVGFRSSNQFTCAFYGNDLDSSAYADTDWHHWTCTYDAVSRARVIYRDGVVVAQDTATANFQGSGSLRLGATTGTYYRGLLDEVAIFQRALAPQEVKALANPLPPGASLMMPMEEPQGVSSFGNLIGSGVGAQCRQAICPLPGFGGHTGRALGFGGSVYASMANADTLGLTNGDFTVAAWVLTGDLSGDRTILGTDEGQVNQGLHLMVRDGKPYMGFYANDMSGVTTLASSRWYHLVWRYSKDTGEQAIFVDGALDKRETGHAPFQGTGLLNLGRSNGGNYLNGFLDDVMIYSRSLSDQEIASLGKIDLASHFPLPGIVLDTQSMSGIVADPGHLVSGVKQVEYAFVPRSSAAAQISLLTNLNFEEPAGSTTFADAAGHGNRGQCVGTTCPVAGATGRSGSALQFDGANDALDLGAGINLANQSFSTAFWAKRDSTGRSDYVIYQGADTTNQGLHVGFRGSNQFTCAFYGNDLDSPAYTDTDWHHWACTYDAVSRARVIYRDGVAVAQDIATANFQGSGNLRLGATGSSLYYKGLLDEVAIFQRTLSPLEIQRVYQNVSPVWRSATLDRSGAGVAGARWSVNVPGDLAGSYQLDLRATDMLGNRTLLPDVWRGEVDTAGPRARITMRPNPDTQGMWWMPPSKIVDIVAESTNFDEERSTVWCGGATTTRTYSTPADASESPRLIKLSASCLYYELSYGLPWYVMVSDRYARLATPTVVQGIQGMAQAQSSSLPQITALPLLQTLIITPTNGLVLTSTDQLNLGAALYAQDSLRDYTFTVDGATVDTQSWASGALTNTLVTALWTPAGEGQHIVSVNLRDWATPARTHSTTATVTLDLAPPTLTMPTTVLTQSQLIELGGQLPSGRAGDSVPVQISGTAADTVGLRSVEVRTENSDWTTAKLTGNDWNAQLLLSSGVYTVTARAFDVAGRTSEISNTVTVDVQPPSAVEPTLGYRIGMGATQPITPGMTLRQTGVTLMLDWSASSDESGVRRYLAGWTTSPTPTIGALTPFAPAATRHIELAASEAQALYAHVVAEDVYGNQRTQTVGPVYVDAPATPDITAQGYHGWMDQDSLLGISRAISETASSRAALYLPQKLHATWDQQALRLAWSGANWQRDGDLFIYLDTKAGGTGTAYNPYPQTPGNAVKLPGAEAGAFTVTPMLADELVWVKDAGAAVLMRWNGTAWASVAQLTADQYRLDTTGNTPITDLRLPFALIGVASPAAANLGMVAFATDEAALRLWAALPNAPGLNSALVNGQGGAAQTNQTVVLLHQYLWPALGSGSVPNTGQYIDTDIEVWITADREASTFSAFDPDLDKLWDVVFDDDGSGDPADYLAELDPGLPRVGNGQPVNYTIHYINHGTATAKGVTASLEAWRSLRLQGATHEVDPERGGVDWIDVTLGDIGPGASGTRAVVGTINTANVAAECSLTTEECADYPQLALLDALIYDDSIDAEGLPIDWLWVEHQVDILAPSDLTIGEPEEFIPAGKSVVWGWVDDESDVPLITLQLRAPAGAVTSVPCANVVDEDGEWECAINVGAAANGAQYQLRAQAKDAFGNTSDWTDWQALTVDSIAPTVTLDQESLDLASEPLSEEGYLIGGVFADNRRVEWVEVCHVTSDGQECADAELQDVDSDGIWLYDLAQLPDADNNADYVLVYAVDTAGNRSSTPARFNYRVDNIGPVIKVDSALTQSRAGQVALKGTVADGGGLDSVYVFAQPLDSAGNLLDVEPIWDEATLSGTSWSYTPRQLPAGSYELIVVAFDQVWNASNQGSYKLRLAGGQSRIYLPLIRR